MTDLAILGGSPARSPTPRQWPVFDGTDEALVLDALRSGAWSRWDGTFTRRFEAALGEYLSVKQVLAVSSGTAALQVALRSCGVERGDEVIVPAYGFVAPVAAVLECGAIPVFADVELDSMCIDPVDVESRVTPRTTALLPMHVGGSCADLDGLLRIAQRHGLALIEDAALALGSRWRGRHVGTLGKAGVFSFQAEKNLAGGEGGALVTDDDGVYETAVSTHDYWKARLFPQGGWNERVWNFRITEVQSALLIGQLSRLEQQTEIRYRNGELLDSLLTQLSHVVASRPGRGTDRRSFGLYAFRFEASPDAPLSKDEIIRALVAEGVPAVGGYARPVYENPLFRDLAVGTSQYPQLNEFRPAECAVAERLARTEAIWLSQQSLLCETQTVHEIAAGIRKVANGVEDLYLARERERP
ncbi:MAG: DegT/DnrJ/EryC1/StrS family aminotransferase [Candidatus Dormibacteraeota bacterium]|nr:DegT/DnrJ/EryC1/StrS family aminotransferase [Candidatus Dormibacteraeota bacterium]